MTLSHLTCGNTGVSDGAQPQDIQDRCLKTSRTV